MHARPAPTVAELSRAERRRVRKSLVLGLVASVLVGVLIAKLSKAGKPVELFLLPLVLLPVLLWRRPRFGALVVLAGAVVIDQFSYTVGPRNGNFTGSIPFFHSISSGSGVTPLEMFLFLFLVIWALKTVASGERLLPRSPLLNCMAILLAFVLVYLLYGLAHGGQYKIAIWEIRPWFYLVTMYVVSASLLATEGAVRTVMWIFVAGSTFKAAYGIDIWMSVRHLNPRPEAVLAHEESFFFGIYIFLTVALWLFGVRMGRLRLVATILLPVVLFGDMTNSRRTAWAILGCGLIVLFIVAYSVVPTRRRILNRIGIAVLAINAVYLPAFWSSNGTIGQPARALHSAIAPDARDKASNQYRETENVDLVVNIRAKHNLGSGFGQPIDYAYAITNLTNLTSSISFIPHDGVLYIWMRMGLVGEIVFWMFICAALIRCCRAARSAIPETSLLGALAAAGVVAYVVMGYEDMGFFWFRLAFCVGALLGVVEARIRVEARTEEGARATDGPPRRQPLCPPSDRPAGDEPARVPNRYLSPARG